MNRLVFAPIAISSAIALAGCSFGPLQRDYVSRADTIPVTVAPANVGTIPVTGVPAEDDAASDARRTAVLLLPEGAGKITKIREKQFANGTRQEIILSADKGTYGENVIDVQVRTAEANSRLSNPMTIGPPSENGMRSEILSRFPDVQMNIVTRPMRNAMGTFGLAIGKHASGSRCVFAWQWVDNLREFAPGASNLSKMNALMVGKGLATSIRIRLCRSDSTVDQLASYIEGLRTGSNEALERIIKYDRRGVEGETIAVNGSRGGSSLVRPVGSSLEAAITKPVRRDASPTRVASTKPQGQRRRVVRRDPARQDEQPQQPAQQYQPPPVYAQPPVQAAQQSSYGQRYLAPVAGAAPQQAYGAAVPGAQAAGGGMALPPQAYRGPSQ